MPPKHFSSLEKMVRKHWQVEFVLLWETRLSRTCDLPSSCRKYVFESAESNRSVCDESQYEDRLVSEKPADDVGILTIYNINVVPEVLACRDIRLSFSVISLLAMQLLQQLSWNIQVSWFHFWTYVWNQHLISLLLMRHHEGTSISLWFLWLSCHSCNCLRMPR